MNKAFTKTKSIIAILFAVSLLITFFAGSISGSRENNWSGAGKNAVVSVEGDTSPFLPAGETQMEKLSSLLQRPVLPVRRTFRFETFSILVLVLLFAYGRAFFSCLNGWRFYETADQFRKSLITYIYHKGDQN